jgi:hypothetical protein
MLKPRASPCVAANMTINKPQLCAVPPNLKCRPFGLKTHSTTLTRYHRMEQACLPHTPVLLPCGRLQQTAPAVTAAVMRFNTRGQEGRRGHKGRTCHIIDSNSIPVVQGAQVKCCNIIVWAHQGMRSPVQAFERPVVCSPPQPVGHCMHSGLHASMQKLLRKCRAADQPPKNDSYNPHQRCGSQAPTSWV